MKVYFIGICNKPGMKPLDSRTQSGIKIDEIIKQLLCECIKTNLCDTDYIVTDPAELFKEGKEWYNRFEPETGDVIVLLGQFVKDNFLKRGYLKYVQIGHPSPLANRKGIDYVENAVKKIKEKLTNVI
jgi:hypothetical protein